MQRSRVYKPKLEVSRYYMVLFTLPKWQYLAVALMLLGVVLIVSLKESSYPLLLNSLLVFITLSMYSRLYKETVFYKFKRRVGMALAVLVYTAVFTFLTGKSIVALVSSTTLLIVVVLGLDGTAVPRYFVAITPPLLVISLFNALGLYSVNELVKGFLSVFALMLLDAAIYAFMSRRKINGHALPDLGTLFLRNWLDKKTEIESVFEDIGEYQYVNPAILELGDLAVVYTDVHYGPFSNVGSSKLPEILGEAFRKIGFKHVIALHGLGSHDRNIVSLRYVSDYVEQLKKTYLSGEKSELKYHGAFTVENGEWRLLGVVFDKLTLIFVSRPVKGIDDLPYDIQLDTNLKAKARGLGEVIVLDSHNWELQGELDAESLVQLIERALAEVEALRRREPVDTHYKYTCFEARALGLVKGESCIVCFSGEKREEACIVYLRGNNMKPGVRDLLLQGLEALKTNLVEVITNDEHSETGTRAYIAYIPVHESQELLEAVKKASENLATAPSQRGVYVYTCRLNLKLLGESMSIIKKHLKGSVRESAVLILTYVFLTPLVLAVFI